MLQVPFSRSADFRLTIREKAVEFQQRLMEFVHPSERCLLAFLPDGLRVRIGIRSDRAMERFRQLETSLFKGFVAHDLFTDENGITWAAFGYSHPLSVRPMDPRC